MKTLPYLYVEHKNTIPTHFNTLSKTIVPIGISQIVMRYFPFYVDFVFCRLSLTLCVCFVDRCLFFCPFSFGHCVVCPSSFGHCVVCPSIYGF
jgi:hypothetical protein